MGLLLRGFVYNKDTFQKDMEELWQYRSTNLTPQQIMAMKAEHSDPAPAPLNIPPHDDDSFSVAAGILADDGYDPALEAQEAYQADQWDK
jgi:hypothetical protein